MEPATSMVMRKPLVADREPKYSGQLGQLEPRWDAVVADLLEGLAKQNQRLLPLHNK